MTNAYIVAAVKTTGGRGGCLGGWHPLDLAATLLNELLVCTKADPALVEDVLMGCVSQVGEQSTNVTRNAVLASKLPRSVPCTSDRRCGSSQQAIHFDPFRCITSKDPERQAVERKWTDLRGELQPDIR
jgi:acetyl-CoA C-acetyltransferase